MTCLVSGQAGHPSNIGCFLPHAIVPGYSNYANLNFVMEFQMTAELRVFD